MTFKNWWQSKLYHKFPQGSQELAFKECWDAGYKQAMEDQMQIIKGVKKEEWERKNKT